MNLDISEIRKLLLSLNRENISKGLEFLISDYTDLYNKIRNQYNDKKEFDTTIYYLININKSIVSDSFLKRFIKTSIVFYIDEYIYEQINN